MAKLFTSKKSSKSRRFFMKLILKKSIVLLLVALCFLTGKNSFGQEFKVNKIYPNIGLDSISGNNEIRFVYPDSNRIYVLGEGLSQDSLPTIFTAAFDYEGNLIWKRNLHLPSEWRPSVTGFHNLVKLKPNMFVAGGNYESYPLPNGEQVSEPFLYYFNSNGDSLNFLTIVDTGAKRYLTTLSTNPQGELITAGTDSVLHYTGLLYTHDFRDSSRNYWFARFNADGMLMRYNKITWQELFTYVGDSFTHKNEIISITPTKGDSVSYIVSALIYGSPAAISLNIEMDSNFRWLGRYLLGAGPHEINNNTYLDPGLLTATQSFNVISDWQHSRLFYSGVGMADDYNSGETFYCTYLCRADSVSLEPPLGTPTDYFVPSVDLRDNKWSIILGQPYSWDSSQPLPHVIFPLLLQKNLHHAHLNMAVNGDLFVEKDAILASDSTDHPQWGFQVPMLIRADSADGHIKWHLPVQYNQTIDTSVDQHFNDMMVAPNGCLVLGGYVNVHLPVPGYDSVGKNSWLVVLCDSVHDNDTTTGIQLPQAGKDAAIMVYPNPTTNYTFVVLKHFEGNLEDVRIQLFDINGKVLQSRKCKSTKELIPLNNYAPGTYFIMVLYQGKPAGIMKLVKY